MENLSSGIDFSPELIFRASRSSGPGGQNVNKVNTRVELRFNIMSSALLTEDEKKIILEKLSNRITSDGILILASQVGRTQMENREKVTEKFYKLITRALTPPKRRKPTSPTRASFLKRKKEKIIRSEKKSNRKSPEAEE
jgi:ribosome-associated protein